MATRTFQIAELYPYEPGAVRSSYEYHRAKYEAEEAVDPPVALHLGDEVWMVIQGNNRVKAAKDAGLTELDLEIGHRDKLGPYRDTLQLREKKFQRGFENYPVFNSESDRSAATMAEMRELGLAM